MYLPYYIIHDRQLNDIYILMCFMYPIIYLYKMSKAILFLVLCYYSHVDVAIGANLIYIIYSWFPTIQLSLEITMPLI